MRMNSSVLALVSLLAIPLFPIFALSILRLTILHVLVILLVFNALVKVRAFGEEEARSQHRRRRQDPRRLPDFPRSPPPRGIDPSSIKINSTLRFPSSIAARRNPRQHRPPSAPPALKTQVDKTSHRPPSGSPTIRAPVFV
ncbi:hypothetical protein BDK51DRAFT_51587 [Blyttiomyces helicus]|uniref:Uncharacterized protein n=1 Tax=Blyttiomyces helicus TaxID=388810 RepID=A0A4P9WA65_9FUNG|nr:hypothetical protein BDK51DRAFT_51587 [Blyttiomyces helicus]|eukprot:RKO87126.1 hypothetical protein BDK51DRAFT_51587 [Blyttiomyces helicus]